MIRFCRNAIEAAQADHRARRALISLDLGVRCTAASLGRAQAQRDAAPAFSPHRSVVLGVCVVVVARLARRTKSHSTRNRPALAPSGYRSDLEISISWSPARWTPADRPRDPATYHVCDIVPSAKETARAIRKHWGIENRAHYICDCSFAEDASRIRKNPGVFARIRSFAANILRFNRTENVGNARYRLAIGGIAALQSIKFM